MRERTRDADRCFICGRISDGDDVIVLGQVLCPICERITVRLTPRHPLYPFWVSMMGDLFRESAGD